MLLNVPPLLLVALLKLQAWAGSAHIVILHPNNVESATMASQDTT